MGLNHRAIVRQRSGRTNSPEAFFDDVRESDVMFVEERAQRRLACPLDMLECWPAAQEVAKEHRFPVFEPHQRLPKVFLEGGNQPVGDTGLVVHQGAPCFDQRCQASHPSALWFECLELIAVAQ
jgi:hypothetical protein